MFITINNNETLYNALLIAHFRKDLENNEIHYFLQNGSKLVEKFDSEDSLNIKFDLVSNIKMGGGSENAVVVETDPTVPNHVKAISESNITQWNNSASKEDLNSYARTSDINNLASKSDLNKYALKSELPEGYISSTSVSNVVTLTQAQFDAIAEKDDATLYVVVG